MSYVSDPSIRIHRQRMPRPSQRKERVRPPKLFVIQRHLVTVKEPYLILDDFSPRYGVNYLDMEGVKIALTKSLKFGRDPEKCEVSISQAYVSREHFEIVTDEMGRHCLGTLPIKNPIKLNGEKLDTNKRQVLPLKDGDKIEVLISKNKYLLIIFRAEAKMQTIQDLPAPGFKESLSN